MKAILYVGAILMTGASIYGFVDYKQSTREGKLSRMYQDEKKETKSSQRNVKAEPVIPVVVKTEIVNPKVPAKPVKTKKPVKAIPTEVRPIAIEAETELVKPDNLPAIASEVIIPAEPLAPVIKKNSNSEKIKVDKKKKKISSKMFSRARVG